MANGLPRALTRPGWNLPSAAGGGGDRGSVWRGKADLSSAQHPLMKSNLPLAETSERGLLSSSQLPFYGKKGVISSDANRKGLLSREVWLLSSNDNREDKQCRHLQEFGAKCTPDSSTASTQSLANLSPSAGRWNSVISPGFLHGRHLFIWIWGGKSGLYVPSPALYWGSPALIVRFMKHYSSARAPGMKLIYLLV